jgi:hypothetical protein
MGIRNWVNSYKKSREPFKGFGARFDNRHPEIKTVMEKPYGERSPDEKRLIGEVAIAEDSQGQRNDAARLNTAEFIGSQRITEPFSNPLLNKFITIRDRSKPDPDPLPPKTITRSDTARILKEARRVRKDFLPAAIEDGWLVVTAKAGDNPSEAILEVSCSHNPNNMRPLKALALGGNLSAPEMLYMFAHMTNGLRLMLQHDTGFSEMKTPDGIVFSVKQNFNPLMQSSQEVAKNFLAALQEYRKDYIMLSEETGLPKQTAAQRLNSGDSNSSLTGPGRA